MELSTDVFQIFSPTATDEDPIELLLDILDELPPPDEVIEWHVVDWQDDDEWWEAHDA